MWKHSQSNQRPAVLEIGNSTVYIRKDIIQNEDGLFDYLEQTLTKEDWDLYSRLFTPTTDVLRSDVDFALALLDADESFDETSGSANFDDRIEKYKHYYESGQWSIARINMLLERNLITQEEYNYIVGENK